MPHSEQEPAARTGASRCPGARLLAPFLAAALVLGLQLSAHARGPRVQGPDVDSKQEQELPELPTAEAVAARLESLEADSELDPAVRDALRESYEQTLALLSTVSELRAQEAQLVRAESEAPNRIEALQAELAAEFVPEPIPEDRTLVELARMSEVARAGLGVARERQDALETEQTERATRREALLDEVAQARARIRSLGSKLATSELSDTSSETERVSVGLERAELEADVAREAALLAEERNYAARVELLRLRKSLAAALVLQAEEVDRNLENAVNELRRVEAERAREEAKSQVQEAMERFPELGEAAADNEHFADLRESLSKSLDDFRERLDLAQTSRDRVQSHYASTRRKVAVAGLTDEMGLLLRHEFQGLLSSKEMARMRAETRAALANAQLRAIQVEEAAGETDALEAEVNTAADLADPDASNAELAEFSADLFATRRDLLDNLNKEYEDYLDQLLLLDAAEHVLQSELAEYRDFIEQRILWVPSVEGGWIPSGAGVLGGLNALLGRDTERGWRETLRSSFAALERRPGPVLWPLCASVLLLLSQRRLRKLLLADAEAVGSPRTDTYGRTVRALAVTALLVAIWPLFLVALAKLLRLPAVPTELGSAVGTGLARMAVTVAMFALLSELGRPEGLAKPHFRWPATGLAAARIGYRWLLPLFVPLMFLHDVFRTGWNGVWSDSAGRVALVVSMGLLTVFLHIVFRPGGALIKDYVQEDREGLLNRTRYIWYAFFVGISASVCLLSLSGYYYTAMILGGSLARSLRFVMLVVLIYALTMRWMYVVRRRLGMEQARARVKAEDGDESEAIDEQAIDLPAIRGQTKQLLRSGLTFALLFGFYGIWSPTIPGLLLLEQVEVYPEYRVLDELPSDAFVAAGTLAGGKPKTTRQAPGTPAAPGTSGTSAAEPEAQTEPTTWIPLPGVPTGAPEPTDASVARGAPGELPSHVRDPNAITLFDLIMACMIGLISLLLARNLPGVLEIVFLERLSLDAGARYAVTTLTRYVIVLIGCASAFKALHIGWSNLQWLAAALTFGLGFGLQEIFANFVSGLIILVERPIRLGDIVVVGGVQGRVTRLHMRATTITDWDRKELLVPNKQFITGSLVNHTLSDSVMRIVIDVHLVYGTDTAQAREVLEKVARNSPLVLDDPSPSAVFVEFGESALKLQLRFFRESTADWAEVMNSTHDGISRAFREAGIEFAFPRRELEVRAGGVLGSLLSGRANRG